MRPSKLLCRTSWPEWRFGEYDDKILAARAYDRAAIAIYGPQRALTSFVIIDYPEEVRARGACHGKV